MKKLQHADEMEMSINFTAARNAFAFCQIAIAIYCIYQYVVNQEISITLLILAISQVIFWATKSILNKQMLSGGDDENEE